MAYNHCTAGKVFKGFFQRTYSLNVKVICRFIEQKHISALFEHHTKVQAVLFTTGKYAYLFILIRACKVEPAAVCVSINFANTAFKGTAFFINGTKFYKVSATTQSFVNSLIFIKASTHLVNVNKFYSLPNFNISGIRLFASRKTSRISNHLKQGCFTGTVRTNNTNNCTGRNMNVKIFKQKLIAERLRNAFKINYLTAQTRTSRNRNLCILKLFFAFLSHQLVIAGNVLFMFCLTAFCTHMNPFKLTLDFLLAGRFIFIFKGKTLIFLFKPA